jgi:hypothetical protein
MQPGDLALVHSNSWTGRIIRLGQSLKCGFGSPYSYFNHCSIVTDPFGATIEAVAPRIRRWQLQQDEDFVIVDVGASAEDRAQIVRFAESCLNEGYGYLSIACISLRLLTGSRLMFGTQRTITCSGMAAEALTRSWPIFRVEPSTLMPSELAEFFHV